MTRWLAALALALPVIVQAEPVTQHAALTATHRLENAARMVLRLEPAPALATPAASPATREQLVAELHRMWEGFRPAFRGRPTTIPFRNLGVERCTLKGEAREQALELLDWGFLAPVGPLMTDTDANLEPEQYGECLGYFMIRLADLTHPWDAEFSPDNMSN